MCKFKVCVYAICKNEEKFVDKWYESMKEADNIYVLDTGSTDNTVEKLKSHGITVLEKKVDPWRFDVARNLSLDMVPEDTDICVCTDLDEILEKGWRKELEKVWNDNTNRCHYTYNWSLDENNKPLVSFMYEKIHSRKNYKWIYPVHEVLEYNGTKENIVTNENITLNHYPDCKKSRSNYLSLLKLSVKENPDNDRNLHYLGREYMYKEMWNESIDTLIKHANLESAKWKDEKAASMRFIARCYRNLNRPEEARMWLKKAINEAPYLRDSYVELALLEYNYSNWNEVIKYANEALKIEKHKKTYINEVFSWDNTIYDLLSIAYYYNHEFENSLKNLDIAISMNHNDERLKENREIILKEVNRQD